VKAGEGGWGARGGGEDGGGGTHRLKTSTTMSLSSFSAGSSSGNISISARISSA